MRTQLAVLAALAALFGCQPEIPSGVYVCSFDGDCPPEMSCEAGRCVRGCTPVDCAAPRCGVLDDGCGGVIDSGDSACQGLETCGAVFENVCGCAPRVSCDPTECGPTPNGCGALLDCGLCAAGEECDAQNLCTQCVAPTCAPDQCGQLANPCGGPPIQCGRDCPADRVCGPGNRCVDSCAPNDDVCAGRTCGQLPDGCGGIVVCPPGCDEQESCEDGACICRTTCADEGAECGVVEVNGCGELACGNCGAPRVCGAGNRCVCEADLYEDNNRADVAAEISRAKGEVVTAIVSSIQDHDWFIIQQPATGFVGTQQIVVELTAAPGADTDNYDLAVFAACGGAGDVTCDSGTPTNDGPSDTMGCLSATSEPSEVVHMVSACVPDAVFVHVIPRVALSCLPYELTVSLEDRGVVPG